MHLNLSKSIKITRMLNAVAVGTSSQTPSAPLDMLGFEGVIFLLSFGTITDGTPAIKARQGQLANMSDAADLANTSVPGAITDDNKVFALDVFRPLDRYVDCVITRGGATGAVIDSLIAIQYGGHKIPTTQDTTVAAIEQHVSPAEGTA